MTWGEPKDVTWGDTHHMVATEGVWVGGRQRGPGWGGRDTGCWDTGGGWHGGGVRGTVGTLMAVVALP